MKELEARTYLLIKDKINNLKSATVAVVGIGGVGGIAAESLVRSSLGNLIIVDKDIFAESNLNRQLLATSLDIGNKKVDVAKKRFESINHDINIIPINSFIDSSNINVFNQFKIDYIIDCIDTLTNKWELIKYAMKNNIPIISIMGMGNRFDASKLVITTLDKSKNDPIAKRMRKFARKDNINMNKINIVISTELPIVQNEIVDYLGETMKERIPPASMFFVPNAAGLLAANFVLNQLIK